MSNNDVSRRSFYPPRIWEEEYVLNLLILKAANIIPLKGTFSYSSKGFYRAIVIDESGREFSTRMRIGNLAPAWNEDIEIRFSSCPIGQKLKLMVLREFCYDDPGTSTGQVVVGRATILVPEKLGEHYEKKVVELVKLVGLEKRVEALISFQTLLTTVRIGEEDIS